MLLPSQMKRIAMGKWSYWGHGEYSKKWLQKHHSKNANRYARRKEKQDLASWVKR